MAIETRIDRKNNLRRHTVTGVLTVEDLAQELKDIYSQEGCQANMNVLWDVRDTDLSSFTEEQVRRIRDLVKDQWGSGDTSRAALVAEKELNYGLLRMYELLLEVYTSNKIRVFKNMEDARKWMNIQD